jgi:hypothetical protein
MFKNSSSGCVKKRKTSRELRMVIDEGKGGLELEQKKMKVIKCTPPYSLYGRYSLCSIGAD